MNMLYEVVTEDPDVDGDGVVTQLYLCTSREEAEQWIAENGTGCEYWRTKGAA